MGIHPMIFLQAQKKKILENRAQTYSFFTIGTIWDEDKHTNTQIQSLQAQKGKEKKGKTEHTYIILLTFWVILDETAQYVHTV